MPRMIPMRAVVAFDRQGKRLQPGDEFTAYPLEAAALRYRQRAAFIVGPPKVSAPPVVPIPTPEPTSESRRRSPSYRRRDMHADNPDAKVGDALPRLTKDPT